ncbi:MAG TPA: YhdP family protein [Gammaproteobacteria bacterium]|nr:YhdP family protein [Gammaproteobacteria bacterium]
MTLKRSLAWTGAILAIVVVAAVAAGAAAWLYYAPLLARHKAEIEQLASARVGAPVEIGALAVVWHGFGPEVQLKDVRVLRPDGAGTVASADAVHVDLTPLSFLSWPWVRPAKIVVENPRLTVARDAAGHWSIPGIAAGKQPSLTPQQILDGLRRVGEVKIQGGIVSCDVANAKPAVWSFGDVDASWDGATASIALKLPAVAGKGASGRITIARHAVHPRRWNWHGSLRLTGFKLATLHVFAPHLPLVFHGGAVDATFTAAGVNTQPTAISGNVHRAAGTGTDTLALNGDWRRGSGGSLTMSAHNADIAFPHLFRGPLPLGSADVPLTFRHDADGWHIASSRFQLANADMTVNGRFNVTLPAAGAPVIDVEAQADDIDLVHKSRYLPVGIMPQEVVDWVDRSVKSGKVPRAAVVFRGAADHFPFTDGSGLFKVDFTMRDALVKFDPHWPAAEHLDADVEFKNAGLTAQTTAGTISGMQIAGTRATIADLARGELVVKGTARGDAAQAVDFLRTSPIAKRFGPYIAKTRAHGKLSVDVALDLPLAHIDTFTVRGSAHLDGVSVKLDEFAEGFDALDGELDFANTGMSSPGGLRGQFLDAPVEIAVAPARNADATRIRIAGKTQAAALAGLLGRGTGKIADGAFSWRARVLLPNDVSAASRQPLTVDVRSDLQGLALALPTPFAKTAKQKVATAASITIAASGMRIEARYGDAIHAAARFAETGGRTALAAGSIHFGPEQAKLPPQGLLIDGYLNQVSLPEWQKLAGLFAGGSGGAPATLRVNLKIAGLEGYGQHFVNLTAGAVNVAGGYRVTLGGPDIAGTIFVPAKVDDKHPYRVDVDRLRLDANFKQATQGGQLSPTLLPPLDFTGRTVTFGKASLGQVTLNLRTQANGVNLKRFAAVQPGLAIDVHGDWITGNDGEQHTHLNAIVTSDNAAAAFAALNLPAALDAKKARIDANFNWDGPPGPDVLGRLGGTMTLHLENGQLTEISPGAARLLGLLSLNALPRRLLLNFRDVFSKGFSFDTIGGNFLLIDGNAYTHDFHLSSPAVDVRVIGRVGLGKQDYDEVVIVNTSISSTLPVVGAIAGGPITGAALFLLTEIFKQPLKKATQIEYHVTGTWENPTLNKIGGEKPPAPKKSASPPGMH